MHGSGQDLYKQFFRHSTSSLSPSPLSLCSLSSRCVFVGRVLPAVVSSKQVSGPTHMEFKLGARWVLKTGRKLRTVKRPCNHIELNMYREVDEEDQRKEFTCCVLYRYRALRESQICPSGRQGRVPMFVRKNEFLGVQQSSSFNRLYISISNRIDDWTRKLSTIKSI